MKTYRHFYSQVYTWENLELAYQKARKGKRARKPAATFEFDRERNLTELEEELRHKTYRPGPYDSFVIHEPKRRLISAAPFRDRVVHHALMCAGKQRLAAPVPGGVPCKSVLAAQSDCSQTRPGERTIQRLAAPVPGGVPCKSVLAAQSDCPQTRPGERATHRFSKTRGKSTQGTFMWVHSPRS
ncbi:MAG: hypothetical protein SWK90_17070 [Chloroflexota bacterium]|nr:hypothetical protein [Chloroflexota bacterium]